MHTLRVRESNWSERFEEKVVRRNWVWHIEADVKFQIEFKFYFCQILWHIYTRWCHLKVWQKFETQLKAATINPDNPLYSICFFPSRSNKEEVLFVILSMLNFSVNWSLCIQNFATRLTFQCPPCRAFTPQLVDVYDKVKASGQNFEILFVSFDRSTESFTEYYKTMPWLTMPYQDPRVKQLTKRFEIEGLFVKSWCLYIKG